MTRVNHVRSPEDLADFLKGLAEDARLHPSGWEHREVADYLSAIAAWVEDQGDFRTPGLLRGNIWRDMARMFLAGKSYE